MFPGSRHRHHYRYSGEWHRMIDDDDDEDDEEWERWMALTDAEQDAEMRRTLDEFNRVTAAMTLEQHAAALRRTAVRSCLNWRRLLRSWDVAVFREHLRGSQKRLVKIRSYRATGIYPGDDS